MNKVILILERYSFPIMEYCTSNSAWHGTEFREAVFWLMIGNVKYMIIGIGNVLIVLLD